MKPLASLLVLSLLCLSATACHSPNHGDGTEPMITIEPTRKVVQTAESVRIKATTVNLVGPAVTWTVSPSIATVTPDGQDSLAAFFTANQVGTYLVTATVTRADGTTIKADTHITVNGPQREEPHR